MLAFIIGGVAVFLFVVIVVLVVLACYFRRQKNRSKQEIRRLQIRLDSQKENIQDECRQAFAELQTDMTDLTNDLDASKKPFYSFESYTFNVLFPGMLDHVILHPPMLLQNKHFVLLLIRTLERQKSFSIRDNNEDVEKIKVVETFIKALHKLDFPSNKLLFAKDIPKYRKWVEKYFSDIQALPSVSDQDLNAYLAEVSRKSKGHFTKENALYELYNYVQKYENEINESLEMDGFASAQQLPAKLGHVITAMEGPSHYTRDYV